MNLEEARLELDATTLRPQDAAAEAVAMAAQDVALGAWLERRTQFDEAAASALSESPIAPGLRERLLLTQKAHKPLIPHWTRPIVITAAAAACLALGWIFLWPVSSKMPAWEADSLAAVIKLQYGLSTLDDHSPTLTDVKTVLAPMRAPSPDHLPDSLAALPTYGCKCITIGDRPATIICFKIASGEEAHLVVFSNDKLDAVPPQNAPQFENSKGWSLATWSDGQQSYLLATKADQATLRKLFGLI
ncbi:MAG: hypothetical protein KDK97_00365 [Verrucomicrobiales bacterium]|nr:hypothetical protein [Verrucomicrobiales bacterium]MCP5556809.1 hypothetical protein [Verrucomicrobiaceae bacterium]